MSKARKKRLGHPNSFKHLVAGDSFDIILGRYITHHCVVTQVTVSGQCIIAKVYDKNLVEKEIIASAPFETCGRIC